MRQRSPYHGKAANPSRPVAIKQPANASTCRGDKTDEHSVLTKVSWWSDPICAAANSSSRSATVPALLAAQAGSA